MAMSALGAKMAMRGTAGRMAVRGTAGRMAVHGGRTRQVAALGRLPNLTANRSMMGAMGTPANRLAAATSMISRANPATKAMRGRNTARYVAAGVGGAALIGGMRNSSGRPADRVSGRPTGVYGY